MQGQCRLHEVELQEILWTVLTFSSLFERHIQLLLLYAHNRVGVGYRGKFFDGIRRFVGSVSHSPAHDIWSTGAFKRS